MYQEAHKADSEGKSRHFARLKTLAQDHMVTLAGYRFIMMFVLIKSLGLNVQSSSCTH